VAIETATTVCGIAYFEEGACVSYVEHDIPRTHAEQLPLYFDELVKNSELDINNLDAIAISIGPGSFTGLRVGLSYTKGLAYPNNLPIIPVPTLHALAIGTEINNDVVILLHSHADIFFYQQFKWESSTRFPSKPPVALTTEEIQKQLNPNQSTFLYGSEKQQLKFEDFNTKLIKPSVKWVGKLADTYYEEWKVLDPKKITPEYISPFKIRSS